MKLYELEQGSYFKVLPDVDSLRVPPEALSVDCNVVYKLHNIDGMYSFCKDSNGNVVHVLAWADVEEISIADEIG